MVVLIRQNAGMTARLARLAAKNGGKGVPVLLDGPYGGLGGAELSVYDRVLLIAGGSGASFIVPLLESLAENMKQVEVACKRVEVVWAIRDEGNCAFSSRSGSLLFGPSSDLGCPLSAATQPLLCNHSRPGMVFRCYSTRDRCCSRRVHRDFPLCHGDRRLVRVRAP